MKNRVGYRTEMLLKHLPHLRDNGKKLLLAYWRKEGLILTEIQEKIFLEKCTKAESITRARRALREDYPGKKDIEEARYKESQRFRHEYGSPTIIFNKEDRRLY